VHGIFNLLFGFFSKKKKLKTWLFSSLFFLLEKKRLFPDAERMLYDYYVSILTLTNEWPK
jgi:hypothetical protein